MNRAELDAATAEVELTEKLDAAKAVVFGGDDSEQAQTALKDAETALCDLRRTARADRSPTTEPGVAAPDPINVTTKGG